MAEAMLKPAEVDLVLRKNFKNIVDKVAGGKVLTGEERAVLMAGLGEEKAPRIRSWTALAQSLGLSRRTLWNLRDRRGGPETFDLKEWKAFLEYHSDATGNAAHDEYASEEIRGLRAKLLRAQAGKEEAIRALRELELLQKEKDLVPSSEARDAIKKVLAPLRELLDAMPIATSPEANPEHPEIAEAAIRSALDKIYRMIQKEAK